MMTVPRVHDPAYHLPLADYRGKVEEVGYHPKLTRYDWNYLYVDVDPGSGSDDNNGIDAPMATLQGALERYNGMIASGYQSVASVIIKLPVGTHYVRNGQYDFMGIYIEGTTVELDTFDVTSITNNIVVNKSGATPAWTTDEWVGKFLKVFAYEWPEGNFEYYHYPIMANDAHSMTVCFDSGSSYVPSGTVTIVELGSVIEADPLEIYGAQLNFNCNDFQMRLLKFNPSVRLRMMGGYAGAMSCDFSVGLGFFLWGRPTDGFMNWCYIHDDNSIITGSGSIEIRDTFFHNCSARGVSFGYGGIQSIYGTIGVRNCGTFARIRRGSSFQVSTGNTYMWLNNTPKLMVIQDQATYQEVYQLLAHPTSTPPATYVYQITNDCDVMIRTGGIDAASPANTFNLNGVNISRADLAGTYSGKYEDNYGNKLVNRG